MPPHFLIQPVAPSIVRLRPSSGPPRRADSLLSPQQAAAWRGTGLAVAFFVWPNRRPAPC
eukprot:6343042-Alexandrium_andersonii.AAC.1